MNTDEQIKKYIESLPDAKRTDIELLHQRILNSLPQVKRWFLDGKNEKGKVVSNPNIGYGLYSIKYSNGTTKDFYQIGISANTSGISVYFIGLDDKNYLSASYGETIGKASISSYCIKFRNLADINTDILFAAIKDRINKSGNNK